MYSLMRLWFRCILATLVVVMAAWLFYDVQQEITKTPDQIQTVNYEQSRAISFQLLRDDERRYLDAAILILAGLWSVAIVNKDDRIKGKDFPEMLMFLIATALFIFFFYLTQRYAVELERAYWDTSKGKLFPDVFNSPYLTMYSNSVMKTFYASLVASAITIFSLCVVRNRLLSDDVVGERL
jgi:hypothetical protein